MRKLEQLSLWPWFQTPHLYHLLADPHERVVQLWVHHLRLLQLEHFLVAARAELLLVFFQTLNNLGRESDGHVKRWVRGW